VARVLIVDDDPDILNLVEFQLRHHGHRVAKASNAEEAERVLEDKGRPDVVVLDVMMPGVSGFDLLKSLRSHEGWENLPAIFLSARVLPSDVERGLELNATYLTKPFVASALLGAIDKAVAEDPDAGEW
jgi:DNA-binding response OmpR family regulator